MHWGYWFCLFLRLSYWMLELLPHPIETWSCIVCFYLFIARVVLRSSVRANNWTTDIWYSVLFRSTWAYIYMGWIMQQYYYLYCVWCCRTMQKCARLKNKNKALQLYLWITPCPSRNTQREPSTHGQNEGLNDWYGCYIEDENKDDRFI